jgi:hypothetical protein
VNDDGNSKLTSTVLEAGHFMYLPRGAAHRAAASQSSHSLHVTLGINHIDSSSLRKGFEQLVGEALAVVGFPATTAEDETLFLRIADAVKSLVCGSPGDNSTHRWPVRSQNIDPDAEVLKRALLEMGR